jgi:hypothetical protein
LTLSGAAVTSSTIAEIRLMPSRFIATDTPMQPATVPDD